MFRYFRSSEKPLISRLLRGICSFTVSSCKGVNLWESGTQRILVPDEKAGLLPGSVHPELESEWEVRLGLHP